MAPMSSPERRRKVVLNSEFPLARAAKRPSKARTISDRLSEVATRTFVGRESELSLLSEAITAADLPFLVLFIHGPGGIGKSRLLQATLSVIGPEVHRYVMDCREIEPTPRGFQAALGAALELQESEPDLHSLVGRLAETGQRTVLALDTYETFGLMDTWLRQELVPALSENVFTIIAGRQGPNPAWLTSPGWQGLFHQIELRELSKVQAEEMLELCGLTPQQAGRVKRFARGHPLALELAATAIRTQPNLEIKEGPPPKILQQLTYAFLAGLPIGTVEAVEAASTVRRVTEPLLRALLDVADGREAFDSLQTLPFLDVTTEGLAFHDVVREAISKNLARRNPERYRTYRRRALSYSYKEYQRAAAQTLWQYTADLLFLIENPIVRDAFFPEGATDIRVEPATGSDVAQIRNILRSFEPEESAQLIERWCDEHLETFSVAKTPDGMVAAFYNLFEPGKVNRALLAEDPLTSAWLRHLGESPLADGERVLFCRRWLDRAAGEALSPAVGSCFLDIKRTYMELRPSLRRIYIPLKDLSAFEPILFPLGFVSVEGANRVLGGINYHTLMNDFGPSSVDGWLATILGTELRVESGHIEESRPSAGITAEHDRRLLTVLFTDIVGSTERAANIGDRNWGDLLERHHALVRRELTRFGGYEIDTTGDGFLATFKRPAQAIRCACAISDAVRALGLEIRAGVHLGECETSGKVVRGIAVHIGARVAAKAGSGEVLVSSTVKDAVAGSEIRFVDSGSHTLKGIPGEWTLFSVERGSESLA
jgi:class 3 adenylate cyclase